MSIIIYYNMAETIKAKVRRVGTSFGVLIPKTKLDAISVNVGDEIEIAIVPNKKDFSGFGLAKNFAVPFVKDKKARNF